jgi:predicted methyltransferase
MRLGPVSQADPESLVDNGTFPAAADSAHEDLMLPIRPFKLAALPLLALLSLLVACSSAPPRTAPEDEALRAAIASPLRRDSDRARDPARHPYETLRLFGLHDDLTVIEIAPGSGWYTEILAPYLRDHGHYVAALYVEDNDDAAKIASQLAATRARFEARFSDHPDRYGEITVGTLRAQGLFGVGPPASADMVLTFRNIHNWIADDHFDAALRAFYAALKPGGVLGVEEHRAAPGTSLPLIIANGYVPESYVIEHARKAGFEWVARSEINANPLDTHEHPNGVWSLPPTLRGGKVDRERFDAIGESDRMTLRFRKPL